MGDTTVKFYEESSVRQQLGQIATNQGREEYPENSNCLENSYDYENNLSQVNLTIENKLIYQTDPTDGYLVLTPRTCLTSDCVTFTENEGMPNGTNSSTNEENGYCENIEISNYNELTINEEDCDIIEDTIGDNRVSIVLYKTLLLSL